MQHDDTMVSMLETTGAVERFEPLGDTNGTTRPCPRCGAGLNEAEIKSLWAGYTQAKRIKRTGGTNGGRPRTKPVVVAEPKKRGRKAKAR